LSVRTVAERAGITHSHLSKVERGSNASRPVLRSIEQVLDQEERKRRVSRMSIFTKGFRAVTIRCRHHACQCARAAELAEMDRLIEALEVHQANQEVECRRWKANLDHPFQGYGHDCELCGEGRRYYRHLLECEDCDGRGCTLCGHTGMIERGDR
jgi:transcriptional regulator with XRE-family HTH domain